MKRTSMFLFFTIFLGCNTPRTTENFSEVTESDLDSVIVHYLEKLDTSEYMQKDTQEEYEVLLSMEQSLIAQLNACLNAEMLQYFRSDLKKHDLQWEQQKDSVVQANEDVSFEEGKEMKEMFLTWQYAYLKELRIIELIRLRDQNCKK